MGNLAPKAVSSPDGTSIVYSAWEDLVLDDPEKSFSDQGIADGQATELPSLRTLALPGLDLEASVGDSEFKRGAYSFAWRDDDTIAYVQGLVAEHRANVTYLGDIYVAGSFDAAPTVWTTSPAFYVVYGWSHHHLLAYEIKEGGFLDILTLTGPGSTHKIVGNSQIVAMSPDGRRLVTADQELPVIRMFDIISGQEIASLDLSSALTVGDDLPLPSEQEAGANSSENAETLYVGAPGSWLNNLIAVPGGPGIFLIRVEGRSLSLDSVMPIPDFPWGITEPQLVEGGKVVAWGSLIAEDRRDTPWAFVTCAIKTAECTRSEVIHAPGAGLSMVYNPSRP